MARCVIPDRSNRLRPTPTLQPACPAETLESMCAVEIGSCCEPPRPDPSCFRLLCVSVECGLCVHEKWCSSHRIAICEGARHRCSRALVGLHARRWGIAERGELHDGAMLAAGTSVQLSLQRRVRGRGGAAGEGREACSGKSSRRGVRGAGDEVRRGRC